MTTSCLRFAVLWFLIWCLFLDRTIEFEENTTLSRMKVKESFSKPNSSFHSSIFRFMFLANCTEGLKQKTKSISLFRAGTPQRLLVLSEVVAQSDPQCPWFLGGMTFKFLSIIDWKYTKFLGQNDERNKKNNHLVSIFPMNARGRPMQTWDTSPPWSCLAFVFFRIMPSAHAMHFLRSHEDEGFLSIPFNPTKKRIHLLICQKYAVGCFCGSTFSKLMHFQKKYHGKTVKPKNWYPMFWKHPLQGPTFTCWATQWWQLSWETVEKRGHKGFGCIFISAHVVKLSSFLCTHTADI